MNNNQAINVYNTNKKNYIILKNLHLQQQGGNKLNKSHGNNDYYFYIRLILII